MNENYAKLLENKDIKLTAIRVLVLKIMLNFTQTFSLADLETELVSVDKSTLSRTIRLFHDHRLIHSIDDGSGSIKYSVCSEDCNCSLNDLHVHFYCNYCKKTFCLKNISIPEIELPEEFAVESVNLVVKGCCERCPKIATKLHD